MMPDVVPGSGTRNGEDRVPCAGSPGRPDMAVRKFQAANPPRVLAMIATASRLGMKDKKYRICSGGPCAAGRQEESGEKSAWRSAEPL